MELKKDPKADVYKRTGLHFAIGLLCTMGLVLTAFNWRVYDQQSMLEGPETLALNEELIIPPTEQPPPPKPPKIQQPRIQEVEEELDEEIEVDLDIEIQQDTEIPDVVMDPDDGPEEEEADKVFTFVESQPSPLGGMAAWRKYLRKNLKYPYRSKRLGVEGTVYVGFVVEKDGSLTDIQIVRGVSDDIDEEAIRVFKNSPEWNPGKQRGRPVRVRYTMRLVFKLG